MDKALKDALRKNRTFLKTNIADVAGVIDRLYSDNILTNSMQEEVMSKKLDAEKILAMLDILPKRGQKAYQALIDALRDTENVDAAQCLCDAREGTEPATASYYSVPPTREIKHPEPKTERESGRKEKKTDTQQTPIQTQTSTDNHWLLSEMFTTRVSQSAEDFYMKKKEENFYDMVTTNRGHVMIVMSIPQSGVSNVNRDSETARITSVFKKLGFKVTQTAIKDKTAEEIEQTIKTKLSDMDFSQAASCVVFALSMGENPSYIYGKDTVSTNTGDVPAMVTRPTYTTPETLMKIMKNCPKLKGKPKILIYQTVPTKILPVEKLPDGDKPKAEMSECVPNDDDAFIVTAKPCQDLEPFIQFSNADGNPVVGTYFITALVYALKQYAAERPFLQILEEVHRLLSDAPYEVTSNQSQMGTEEADKIDARPVCNVQVAQVKIEAKSMNKALYFFPGVKSVGQQPTT